MWFFSHFLFYENVCCFVVWIHKCTKKVLTNILNYFSRAITSSATLFCFCKLVWIRHLNENMNQKNDTSTDFILLGLFPWFRHPNLLYPHYHPYLHCCLYWKLHTNPPYLAGLPSSYSHVLPIMSALLIDLAYISCTVPKMVTNYFTGKKNISYFSCATQLFFFLTLGLAECILLTLMAYDRYVAVCNPLRYTVLMNPNICLQMATRLQPDCGALAALVHTIYPMNFPICGSREINHYFCEMPAIPRLSCMDISAYEMVKFVSTIVFLLIPFILILTSYTLYLPHCSQDELKQGQEQSPGYLLFSHDSGESLLWSSYLHLHDTHLSPYTWTRPDWSCSYTHSDPHAQPTHLQPEE